MNNAPASVPQLTAVGAVVLAHAAGLWALLDPTLRSAAPAAQPQVTMVRLLGEPAAAAAPPPLLLSPPPALPPPPRVAPPDVPRPLPVAQAPEPAATALPAPAAGPGPSQPLPAGETAHSAQAADTGAFAAEGKAAAPLPQTAETAAPSVARRIEHVDYLRAPVLQYPSASRRFGEQGRVVLRVLIGPDGQAERVELEQASAFRRLNEAAIEAARRALYKPYTEDGVAQPAWALVAMSFELRR
jgi:protein TonB